MDLLVEKLDGSRYYLSQYKVLITEFEESAPSVTRNNTQLDQRNGNIDFGGWHTDKTINITGYYRADDMDEEEALREKLYALLSDPDGYYITQLKTTPSVAMELPGETSGSYYDKLGNYPSHKRFLVYTEAPEMELVGNVNGTLLYKLTAEFKTLKLPYGETPLNDVSLDSPYKDVPVNLLLGTTTPLAVLVKDGFMIAKYALDPKYQGGEVTLSFDIELKGIADFNVPKGPTMRVTFDTHWGEDLATSEIAPNYPVDKRWVVIKKDATHWHMSITINAIYDEQNKIPKELRFFYALAPGGTTTGYIVSNAILTAGASTLPWSPNPADPEYNEWYYSLTGNVSIPYSGTVPCNQLEQGFSVELTAHSSASSLSFKIDDTELTYSGGVASGDVFLFTGFSYKKNGLSIVSKTNKSYFILQPDKPNRITCNVPGTVRILGFQNLYA